MVYLFFITFHFIFNLYFFDHYFNFNFIFKDIAKRPFITFGFISFLFLVPLAITSTNYMVKLLSFKIWKRLHYLIYPVAILASLHFLFLKKADKTEPLIYLIIITMLLLWRIFSYIKKT